MLFRKWFANVMSEVREWKITFEFSGKNSASLCCKEIIGVLCSL
jgi:hypothetical protein